MKTLCFQGRRDVGRAVSFFISSFSGINPMPSYLMWMCCVAFPSAYSLISASVFAQSGLTFRNSSISRCSLSVFHAVFVSSAALNFPLTLFPASAILVLEEASPRGPLPFWHKSPLFWGELLLSFSQCYKSPVDIIAICIKMHEKDEIFLTIFHFSAMMSLTTIKREETFYESS